MNRYRKQAAFNLRLLRNHLKKYGPFRLYWDHATRASHASGMYLAATCAFGKRYFTAVNAPDLEWTDIAYKNKEDGK